MLTLMDLDLDLLAAKKGITVPTGNGGAMRFVRRNRYDKYRLAFWLPNESKFIETDLKAEEPEEEGFWKLAVHYDEAFEKMPCKKKK